MKQSVWKRQPSGPHHKFHWKHQGQVAQGSLQEYGRSQCNSPFVPFRHMPLDPLNYKRILSFPWALIEIAPSKLLRLAPGSTFGTALQKQRTEN